MRSPRTAKDIIKSILMIAIFVVALFFGVSHQYFQRSAMATLAEFYMVLIDRDKIYSEGEAYDENLEKMKTLNTQDTDVAKGVKMDISVRSTHENGMQIFYLNEESERDTAILYLCGGAYLNQPLKYHWTLLNTLGLETDCPIIMPIYLKVPNYSCEQSLAAMVEFYLEQINDGSIKRLIIAGDSSGGGMALALSMILRDEHPEALQPAELLLIAPWLDVSMENEHIPEYEPVDPMLDIYGAVELGKMWAGDLGVHHPHVSPIYGTYENLGKITLFIGTRDMLCPDNLLLSEKLTEAGIEHTLIVEEGLDHPYPLFPTPEAKDAQKIMIDIINEQ